MTGLQEDQFQNNTQQDPELTQKIEDPRGPIS